MKEDLCSEMKSVEGNLELTVRYRNLEARFAGKPDEVIRALLNFISRVLPAYDLAAQLTLSVDIEDLLRALGAL